MVNGFRFSRALRPSVPVGVHCEGCLACKWRRLSAHIFPMDSCLLLTAKGAQLFLYHSQCCNFCRVPSFVHPLHQRVHISFAAANSLTGFFERYTAVSDVQRWGCIYGFLFVVAGQLHEGSLDAIYCIPNFLVAFMF